MQNKQMTMVSKVATTIKFNLSMAQYSSAIIPSYNIRSVTEPTSKYGTFFLNEQHSTSDIEHFFKRTTLDECVSIDIAEKIQDYVPGRP